MAPLQKRERTKYLRHLQTTHCNAEDEKYRKQVKSLNVSTE
ncbi:hypothetical protein S7335_2169 [Synechococcus sp. PCC 7335]|nr:hypothetical protein S7335_2169 [Synechococcus sp. PCC 7335]